MIKSPLNYTGGKFKLLGQILPLLTPCYTFWDCFCGGLNVGINANAERVVAIDNQCQVIELFNFWRNQPLETTLDLCEAIRTKYQLSKTNKAGFLTLRKDYNDAPDPGLFYMLVTNAFNCQIRFARGKFNMPFGKDRHDLNPTLRLRLIEFIKALQGREMEMRCADFDSIDAMPGDLVYCDPPYLIAHAAYNKHNTTGVWDTEKDLRLMQMLDKLNSRGVRWALSNVLRHEDMENTAMLAWSQQYHVHHLSVTYRNCSYHKIDRAAFSEEVLITNY